VGIFGEGRSVERDIYSNLSPLDARYYKSNKQLLDEISAYLSEKSVIRYEAVVESAIITVMERHGVIPKGSSEKMKKACREIDPEAVYREEEITRHNIRALVRVLQRSVGEKLAPYIHLTATSEDITGTAASLRMRDVFFRVVLPKATEFMDVILAIALREADTVQIGRTHGQHAVPITVGYLFSGYADRFGGRVIKIIDAVKELKGKLSGAVGAYNAQSLIFDDPRRFEQEVLSELSLSPASFSSQIIEPEYTLDLIHAVVSAFGVLAQIADDIRNLQRTEIGELGERFEKGQVGSSTMPHKRNPWNFEHVKSMWKEFTPRVLTRYYDQISEHQRDLTNSASGRFTVEIITGFTLALDRLASQCKKLVVDKERLNKNLEMTKGMFLAEPLYILLALQGFGDAHQVVKELTLRAEKQGESLSEILENDSIAEGLAHAEAWQKLLKNPAFYTGKAGERALEIAQLWKARVGEIRKECDDYKSSLL
jgi:adenylosuccinate lyase